MIVRNLIVKKSNKKLIKSKRKLRKNNRTSIKRSQTQKLTTKKKNFHVILTQNKLIFLDLFGSIFFTEIPNKKVVQGMICVANDNHRFILLWNQDFG